MDLRKDLQQARCNTDSLFSLLSDESLYLRPIPERHRIIFYIGHLEAFDWNLIARNTLGLPSFDPQFDKLFEFGIDPPVGTLPQDQPSDWPSIDKIRCYCQQVRSRIDAVLDRVPEQIAHVAIEHRWMHSETLAYMFHNLPLGTLEPVPATERRTAPPPPPDQMIEVPAGTVTLGKSRGEGFGWDNEFEASPVGVEPFAIAKYKVTNGEFLEFVRQGSPAPHFWVERSGRWHQRTMFDEVPLPLDWPVYVTHDQASAFARWRGKALPSEAQFQRAAYGSPSSGRESDPDPRRGNFDFRNWNPDPVGWDEQANPFGLSQAIGNGWEWTSTPFGPLPGFKPFDFYPGYSANFFDGEHYVMKGASMRTAACFTRRSFRNWFRRDYPYMYAGFRLVDS